MDNCEKYIEMISCLVDGELSDEQMSELNTHMENCEECRMVYNAFKGISSSLSDGMVEPPEKLAEGIMYKVKLADKGGTVHRFAFGRFTAIAACLAIIIFAGARFNLFNLGSNSGENQELAAAEMTEDAATESLEIEEFELDESAIENATIPEFGDAQFSEQSEASSGSQAEPSADGQNADETTEESAEMESTHETSSLMALSEDNLINDEGEIAPLADTTSLRIFEGELSSSDIGALVHFKSKNSAPVLTFEDTEELSAFANLLRIADSKEYDVPSGNALYTLWIEERKPSTGTDIKEPSFVALYIYQTDNGLFASLENSEAAFKLDITVDELDELIYPQDSLSSDVIATPAETPVIQATPPQHFDTAKLNESMEPIPTCEVE